MNKNKKIEVEEDDIEEHSHIEHSDKLEKQRLQKEIERDLETVPKTKKGR